LLVLGAEPVLFSVDYPYSSIDDGIAFFRATPISGRDRELIAHVNAERLLKL
jgi:predicted TIM-barrel fold metal-dependent hydrolase